MKYELFQGA